jgi:TRAP-type C4-dicarboxylate transport system substrate-binding protein
MEEASGGELKIKWYLGGSLVGAKEMMEAVRDKAADVVSMCPSFFRSKVPLSSLSDVAFLCSSDMSGRQTMVLNMMNVTPMLEKEYDYYNAVFLWATAIPPYNLMGKVPIRTIKDLQGVRIRALGGLGDVLSQFGASPMVVPGPETFTALDRGVIDLVAGGGDYWMHTYKIHEASKYYTVDMDMSSACSIGLMNKETYEKLPDKVKEIMPSLREKIAYVNQEGLAGEESLKKWREEFKARGIEIIHFPPEDRKKLVKAAEKYWEKWIEKFEKTGVKEAREGLNLQKNLVSIVEAYHPKYLNVSDELKRELREAKEEVLSGK